MQVSTIIQNFDNALRAIVTTIFNPGRTAVALQLLQDTEVELFGIEADERNPEERPYAAAHREHILFAIRHPDEIALALELRAEAHEDWLESQARTDEPWDVERDGELMKWLKTGA